MSAEQRHVVIVENEGEDVTTLHPFVCNKVQRDGFQEMDCMYDRQISEWGFRELTAITEDGTYLVEPWYIPAEYHPVGDYICDADSGMNVTTLTSPQ